MIRNLHELCNIQYGYAFDSASFTDDASYTPLVRIRDVKRGYSETYYSGAYSDEYIIRAGDLLVGMDGEFNAAKWKSRDALLNQRVCKIIAKKETDGEYLRFALSVALKIIEERTAFVTVKHLSVKELNKIKIQAPSYEEQKNIAGILLRIEEIIQAKQDELRKLDSLIKARFVEMFGDPSKGDKIKTDKRKIGEIATVTKLAGFEFTKYINYQEEGDIIMLRGLNCKNGHLVLDDIKWIDQAISDALPRSKLYKGDILMTYAGTIGDVAMVDKDNTYHLAPNVGKISINNTNEINPVFLTQLFLNTHDYIMSFASQVAQASINMQKIRDFDYYFPPIELQNQFATFVTQVDKSKFTLQNSIISLMNLWYNINQYVCERMYGEA